MLKLLSFLILFAVYLNADETAIYKSATELDYPPFSVTENGKADGFSVDLLKSVANEVDIQIDFKIDEWETIKNELKEGKLDILPLVSYNEERDKYFDFTVPYLVMHGNIFVRNNNTSITSEKDLKDKEIIVMKGDTAHEYAIKMNFTSKIILTKTYKEAFMLLSSGKYDAVLAQSVVGLKIINDLKLKNIKPLTKINKESLTHVKINLKGFEQKFSFAVKEGDKELLAKLNEGLAIIVENGEYQRIYDKWFPFLKEQKSVSIKSLIMHSIIILIPIFITILFFNLLFIKKEVARKTYELSKEIEERKKIELKLLEEKEKAEKASKTKSDFLSNMSHELRTPLNGIIGFSDLLIEEENNEHKKELLLMIENCGKSLLMIINDILDISKIEAGKMIIKSEPAELNNILKGIENMFFSLVKDKNNEFIIKNKCSFNNFIGDEFRITQILINLVGNSNKFTKNGKISVIAEEEPIDNKNAFVIFTIEDTGIGINEDKMNNLFEMFNQGEHHLTKKYGGTGLGLSIVKKLTDLMNGEIKVSSEINKGTVFKIKIPVKI